MNKSDRNPITLAIHWARFGPYHLVRLWAAFYRMQTAEVRVIGLETASMDEIYSWAREDGSTVFERYTAFPGRSYHKISPIEMWSGVTTLLNRIKPDVVAVAGYGLVDAWAILGWCRIHRRPAILMSESKADDSLRVKWKEWLKQRLVSQFAAALCGGSPHRAYLEDLGMKPDRIFKGYDVVDNDYFWQAAEQARQQPTTFRYLPGLEKPGPFFLASARFIQRKNLDGLLRAYGQYCHRLDRADNERDPWRLVILGDGVMRDVLENLIRDEGLTGVSLPGFRQIGELPAYYGLGSAFVHPALQEPWGLVVNEAMAAGLPVLVSNRCGCASDLVNEGENGFTFDPEDIDGLADLMYRLSSGQVDLQAMSRASRSQISRWEPDRFAQGLYNALQVALELRL